MTETKRGGRPAGSGKLDGLERAALLTRLREGLGPVNLKVTAAAVGVSRPTLMRYIAAEPGLHEVIEQRRKTAGRGYVQVQRGTCATRRAARTRQSDVTTQQQDPFPTGSAAKMFAKLWQHLAGQDACELEARGASTDGADEAAEVLIVRAHLANSRAHATVFEGVAVGRMDAAEARAKLDALTKPPTRPGLDEAAMAVRMQKQRVEEEKVAAAFKAIYGYRPSAKRLKKLLGTAGRAWAPGEWNEATPFRELDRAMQITGRLARPRKSYPPRPKDSLGRPLVARGVMAKLLREQEAKGLTGQAAKDAATAAALASLAAASDAVPEG